MARAHRASPAALHVLTLPEHDDKQDDYARFRMKWLLVGAEGHIVPGDVIHFPELLTGAGEFEGMRFVGPPEEGGLPLLLEDVEALVFPQSIVAMHPDGGLRARYEHAILAITESQHVALADMFGGEADLEAFWASPDVYRGAPAATEGEYIIPYGQCTTVE